MDHDPVRPAVRAAAAATMISSARALSNAALVSRVRELAGEDQRITAALIAHLAVLDERQLYLMEGCASMFVYLTQALHFSEHAAYGRIQAARAARRYPLILDLLADGSVNLTTITLLAPELTERNHRELLEAVVHKSRRQVELFLARLRPHPPVRPLIRRLSTSPPSTAASDAPAAYVSPPDASAPSAIAALTPAPADAAAAPAGTADLFPSTRSAPAVAPPAPAYYRVQFTASEETHAKLRAAQDLLRHQIPDGDVGQILDRALSALLVELARRKVGASGARSDRPPPGGHRPAGSPRYVPAEVRRSVWMRDGGRCAFIAPGGRRCAERGFLEFHHIVPFSAGGPSTVDNIELRCRAHNGYEVLRPLEDPSLGEGEPLGREEPQPSRGPNGEVLLPPPRGPG